MNVNKKFDRFKQWAGEKMGGDAKTNTSDDFKMLELEMNLRHEGMEKMHKSMSLYVKHVGKKSEGEERDKVPIGYLGSVMVSHGQDFSPGSEFGSCLTHFGRANEAIARRQEAYVGSATGAWLESLERSLAQLKEYQAARKKLEQRRLAYDASLAKMQKAKKEDFRVEEDLRAQKAKYEESSEDVYRRMEDIKESEVDSVADLTQFLESELSYHEGCRNILLELRKNWPAQNVEARKLARNRSNTAHSYTERFTPVEEKPPSPPQRPTIPKVATRIDSMRTDMPKISRTNSLRQQEYGGSGSRPDSPASASGYNNRYGDDLPRSRDYSPDSNSGHLSRTSTNEPSVIYARTPLRPLARADEASPARDIGGGSWTPTSASSSVASGIINGSSSSGVIGAIGAKKAPPPPPPSRAKKPAPPPPMKRASYSTSQIPNTSTY